MSRRFYGSGDVLQHECSESCEETCGVCSRAICKDIEEWRTFDGGDLITCVPCAEKLDAEELLEHDKQKEEAPDYLLADV